jgi:hypothetical protein
VTTSSGERVARPSLVSLLAEAGVASEAELRRAVAEAHEQGLRLGELVVRRGWADEEAMARLLADQWGLPFLGRESLAIDPVAAGLLPFSHAHALGGCVLGIRDHGPLTVVADPTTERLNALRAHLDDAVIGCSASFAVVTASSLEGLLAQLARIDHSRATDHDSEDRPLTDLEQAVAAEAALRARIDELERELNAAEEQLEQLRGQLQAAEQERARDRQQIRELQGRLDTERSLFHDLKRRLAELLAELAPRDSGSADQAQ